MKQRIICVLVVLVVLILGGGLIINEGAMAAQVAQPEEAGSELAPAAEILLEPQPHPILSDVRIRQAIAYCTDKDGLVAAAYPELTPEERQGFIADTWLHPSSWAYSEPEMTYPYSPTMGIDLLEAAGWLLPAGGDYRMKEGNELVLQVRTTSSDLRMAVQAAFESQMLACGIHLVRGHEEDLEWLKYRDFEAAEFAWLSGDDPQGEVLFACDSVPAPENGWTGYNYTGWCNEIASEAITLASDTRLTQEERQAYYAIFIDQLAQDMPVLPLFFRDGNPNLWEHIDFNLETYAQDGKLTPGGTGETPLAYEDYQGNAYALEAPAGAVTQTVTVRFTPLAVESIAPPEDMLATNALRLSTLLSGVPLEAFELLEPLTLTVGYDTVPITYHYKENTLALYIWDEDAEAWEAAANTCPEGERHELLNTEADLYEVQICSLGEFGLFMEGGESLRMGVEYGMDEVAGMYEIGHTFEITVTDSTGALKATATALTVPEGEDTGTGPIFGWLDGFWVQQEDWSDPELDILPGDWVYFQADDEFSHSIQVGTISARLDPILDRAVGTITVPGIVVSLEGFAGAWGLDWEEFNTSIIDNSFLVEFDTIDLMPGMTIHVGYREPDLDQVSTVFSVPEHQVYLPLAVKEEMP